jgi:hypothetical protein
MELLIEPAGHVRFQQLSSCQLESSCYYLVLRQPDPVGEYVQKVEVSVLAVRYRAFVFAAPQCFVTGNRPMECRGAVSVGKVSSASQLLQQKFLALL